MASAADYAQSQRRRQAKRSIAAIVAAFAIAGLTDASLARADERPQRIVSVNLCADQLLLALADPQQIAAISWNAVRPVMSFYADKAAAFRTTRGEGEEVVALEPDLVVAGRFAGGPAKVAMRRAGLRVHDLDTPTTPLEAADQLEKFGALIGQRERGAAAAATLREQIATAAAEAPAKPLRAFYLQRRGVVLGRGTMIDALMRIAGLENAIKTHGYAQVGLERLATIQADLLIVDGQGQRADGDATDWGASLLTHPLIAARFPPEKRIHVPVAEIVCAGPALASALQRLTAAAR